MFKHLPVITEASVMAMVDKELDYFEDRLKRCAGANKMSENKVLDCACSELYEVNNPYLVKAVGAVAAAVAEELKGKVEPGIEWRAGLAAVPGVLTILRLIDRALEAKELDKSFGT